MIQHRSNDDMTSYKGCCLSAAEMSIYYTSTSLSANEFNRMGVARVGVNSAPELDFLANSKSNSGIELELALPSPGGIGIELELPSFELELESELRSSELNSELPSWAISQRNGLYISTHLLLKIDYVVIGSK